LHEKPDEQPWPLGFAFRAPSYACLLCCGAHCYLHDSYRRRIRTLYGVPPVGPFGETGDFFLSWCAHSALSIVNVDVATQTALYLYILFVFDVCIFSCQPLKHPQVLSVLRTHPREAHAEVTAAALLQSLIKINKNDHQKSKFIVFHHYCTSSLSCFISAKS
jgi:hypothetical protein